MNVLFNKVVNYFFALLIIVTIAGAIVNLFNATISGESSIYFLDFFIILIFGLSFLKSVPYDAVIRFYNDYRIFCNLLFCIIILSWQIYLVITVSGISSWDPSSVLTASTSKTSHYFSLYLSFYPNNYGIFLLYRFIWMILGEPGNKILIIVIGFLNYLLLDISLLSVYKFAKTRVNGRASKIMFLISLLLIGISPWGCLAYTDLLAFDLTCFTTIGLYFLIENFNDKKLSIINSVKSGILLSLDYIIKPSLVIPFISFAIVLIMFRLFRHKKDTFRINFLNVLTIILIALPIIVGVSCLRRSNALVHVDNRRSYNVYHYVAMGIYKNGGFNNADNMLERNTKDPEKRKDKDIQLWRSRLKKRGIVGYQSFVIRKQTLNSSDASFGWGKEGGFLKPFSSHRTLSHKLFYAGPNRSPQYAHFYTVLVQLTWIFLLLCMLVNVCNNGLCIQFLKISFIGFSLFLLIFEGGRSRYMIQFLPICFILFSFGFDRVVFLYRKLMK